MIEQRFSVVCNDRITTLQNTQGVEMKYDLI